MLKKLSRFFFLFTLYSSIAQAQVAQLSWSDYITISEFADGYGRPRIVLTEDQDPLIIWRKDASPKVLRASKWDGNSFTQPYDILSPDILPTSWDGPEAVSKGDTVYVVFTSSATSNTSIMLIRSFDGGTIFSDTIRVSPQSNSYKYRMPNVSIKPDGNPVVSYMQYLLNWMEPKQIVATSNDYGSSFTSSTEASALAPGEPCDCCKSSLAIASNNDVFLLYRNNNNNERNTFISKSIDGGNSFLLISDLDDYDWVLNACPESTPKGVVVNDSIVVVKRSGASGNNELVCTSVNTNDLNFVYNNNIHFLNGAVQDYPEISGVNDTFAVVWQDNRDGIQNCYLSISTNGAFSLKNSISFTDSTSNGYKYDPDVEYANKDIHLVYLDYSNYKIVYVKATFGFTNNIQNVSLPNSSENQIIGLLGDVEKKSVNKIQLVTNKEGLISKQINLE